MSVPEGTGSNRDPDDKDDIVLPSWIDAAISRTREGEETPPARAEPAPLPEDAVEPMADDPPTEEYIRPVPGAPAPSSEPFPSFLDRRGSMEHETERIANPQPAHEPLPETVEHQQTQEYPLQAPPQDFLARRVTDDFDAQRAAIVSQAMAEDPAPRSEPIPLPVAPPRRRAPSGPWLMAAIFFAAAALVLAVLIWLRPLPR